MKVRFEETNEKLLQIGTDCARCDRDVRIEFDPNVLPKKFSPVVPILRGIWKKLGEDTLTVAGGFLCEFCATEEGAK